MDERFSFWYPVVVEEQPDFEGRIHKIEIVLRGHIIFSGTLMCGGSREVLKNRARAKKEKTVSQRIVGKKLCPMCLELYKAHPESAYYKFAHAVAVVAEKEAISKDVVLG